ncbi:MAG: helix-turn-helix domain-containing protein [Phycisphaerae bacterium]|nr:helix-turn-helix domain-containing protein [Phycisphaerae bacterium]
MDFGQFFKEKRQARNLSIRQFCTIYKYDSGNISKLERGVLPPPQSKQKIDEYAKALGIKKGSDDYSKLLGLAFMDSGAYQFQSLFRNVSAGAREKLPALFSKLSQGNLTEEKITQLIAYIEA